VLQPWLHFLVRVERGAGAVGEWVMLTYWLPREPSTPRSSVWRKLRRLGVAQLADGLVALPADARTREQLEWVADEVREADGDAAVWLVRPTSRGQERALAATMAAARAAEYRAVLVRARQASTLSLEGRARVGRLLRKELRRIRRRDFFPPAERDAAVIAVEDLVCSSPGVGVDREGEPAAGTAERSASRGGRS
jgi:hypothetical protein